MSFHYDPMTGEKIEDAEVVEETTQESSTETSQGTVESTAEEVGAESVEANGQGNSGEYNAPQMPAYNPVPGFNAIPDENPTEKKPNTAVIAVIAVAVAAVIILGFALSHFMGSSKYGKNGKFITAFENSLEWGPLAKAMDVSDIVESGKVTLGFDANVYGQTFTTEYGYDRKAGKASLYAACQLEDTTLDATVFMDKEKALIDVPELLKKPLMYNFTEEKTGYITSIVNEDNIEKIDEYFKSCTSAMDSDADVKKYQKRLKDIFIKSFNELDFKKTDAETFEINGKDKKCQGYTAELNEEFYRTFSEELEKFLDDYSEEYAIDDDKLGKAKDAIEDFNDEIEDMPEASLTIYLTDKKVAMAELDSDDHKMSIEFNGGNYWTENMKIDLDGTDIDFSGEVTKNISRREIEFDGTEVLSYEYDTKEGNLELNVSYGMAELSLEGNLDKTKDGLKFSVDDITASGVSVEKYLGDFDAAIRIEKGAKLHEVDSDKVYDLGTMEKEDFDKLSEKVQKNLLKLVEDLPDSIKDKLGYGLPFGSSSFGGYGSSYGDNYDDDDDSSYGSYGDDDDDSSYGNYGDDDDDSSYGNYGNDDEEDDY